MDTIVTPRPDIRLRELGAFLRRRRELLTPSAVGLPNGFRRRTPGLRREEIALLAGVGTTWYTWLEQGRDVRPSIEVLNALAVALKLDQAERRHLFILANRPAPEPFACGPEVVPDALIRMLENMSDQPSYVHGRRWDILAWNHAATKTFGDFGRFDGDKRNLVYLMFVDPDHRRLLVDWEELAPLSLAMFRSDSARYVSDPEFERLIALLMTASEDFRALWPRHDVLIQPSTVKRVRHPSAGPISFEHMVLDVTNQPGMRLVVCTPQRQSEISTPTESVELQFQNNMLVA